MSHPFWLENVSASYPWWINMVFMSVYDFRSKIESITSLLWSPWQILCSFLLMVRVEARCVIDNHHVVWWCKLYGGYRHIVSSSHLSLSYGIVNCHCHAVNVQEGVQVKSWLGKNECSIKSLNRGVYFRSRIKNRSEKRNFVFSHFRIFAFSRFRVFRKNGI